MDPHRLGFKIERVLELQRWKVLEVDSTIPLAIQPSCPSDATSLKTICTLVGKRGRHKLRIGCCPACGYVGYIDRPTKDWIARFYLETWDSARSQQVMKKAKKLQEAFLKGNLGKEREVIPLLKKLNLDKERYICEIGCGYGKTLKQIERLGFTKLIGVENSRHRAEVARQAYNLKVLTSPFEDDSVQSTLKKVAPLSLVFAYHTLEHTYNPAKVIQLVAGLQEEGDYLIISVPNVKGEVSMAVLASLSHLHSFSRMSLKRLLHKNNYLILDDSLSTNMSINLLAQKIASSDTNRIVKEDYYDKTVEKFIRGLGLAGIYSSAPRRLWWFHKEDVGGQLKFYQNKLLERLHWRVVAKLNKYRAPNSLLINSLATRYTSYQESSLEIQFKGNVKLFYK